jgi:hypothetical protein
MAPNNSYYDPKLDRFTEPPAPAPNTPEGIALNMQKKVTGELNSLLSERAKQPGRAILTLGLIVTAGCSIVSGLAYYVMTHPQEFPGLFLK